LLSFIEGLLRAVAEAVPVAAILLLTTGDAASSADPRAPTASGLAMPRVGVVGVVAASILAARIICLLMTDQTSIVVSRNDYVLLQLSLLSLLGIE